jgi:hypothetical protein
VLGQALVDVGRAAQEPEELVHDPLEQHLLGGQEGEALAQVVAGLGAEDRQGADPGAVLPLLAVFEDVADERKVGLHAPSS